ncbi:MAG TPA: 2OG-Fe(II) oxygenase [Solirubrobacteraceae bacterium]|jgi:hypothetical protein|nr:2OG-Fe(II) oxygenase [Solirubrobacteraceae bacterium]
MSDSARDRLGVLLSGATDAKAFSAARTAPTRDLQLEVRGVGMIELPVPQSQAKQLCLLARPARHGRGERTVLDRRVRDTWEVPKSRVKIDKRRWNRTLQPVLDRLRQEIGLPSGRTLRAELHSMLVYAPGQFFLEHQDSEKDDAMVGSLVVGLPSTFKGGALEVRHGGRVATYRGSKKALSFVAFYSDCRHQVKPVRAGYRVALTYNLLLGDRAAASDVDLDPELVGGVARCLEEHFAAPDGPDRLVYLLDHEYTRRGLDRSRLKGADAERATFLAAAAERANCEAVLALADVHETWSAYDSDERWYGRSGGGRWHDWDEADDELEDVGGGGTAEDYDLEELIESEVTLDSWVDPRDGRLKDVGLSIGDDEVCASTASGELEPYSSEYEGYMGNWGNTLDRWYHRGAAVVWPRSRAFAVQAKADPSFALDEVARRARTGDLAGAQEAATAVTPFWHGVAARVEAKGLLAKALRTARLLDEPALAAMLLRPFRLQLLRRAHAKALSALVDSYGEQWVEELLATWSAERRFHYRDGHGPEAWISSLPPLCLAFREVGSAGTHVARLLLRESWRWVAYGVERGLELPSPSAREQSLGQLGPPLAAVLEGASLVAATDLRDGAVEVLCRQDELLDCAIATLRATSAARWSAVGLDVVAAHSITALDVRLARPPRNDEDWSIELPEGCGCELCDRLGAFLEDPAQRQLGWPLAKERRRHVHGRIDTAELPVDHQTRRVGRPYTLVLAKTAALFEREAQQRRRDRQTRAWLDRSASR